MTGAIRYSAIPLCRQAKGAQANLCVNSVIYVYIHTNWNHTRTDGQGERVGHWFDSPDRLASEKDRRQLPVAACRLPHTPVHPSPEKWPGPPDKDRFSAHLHNVFPVQMSNCPSVCMHVWYMVYVCMREMKLCVPEAHATNYESKPA